MCGGSPKIPDPAPLPPPPQPAKQPEVAAVRATTAQQFGAGQGQAGGSLLTGNGVGAPLDENQLGRKTLLGGK